MRNLLRDILDYFRHNKDDDKVGVIILESDHWNNEVEITIIDRSELQ